MLSKLYRKCGLIMLYNIIITYLVGVNIAGIALMGIDKGRAVTRRWRIKERNLFLVALIGGSLGCIIGMQLFRHKTKHVIFTIGMPAILILQFILVILGVLYL